MSEQRTQPHRTTPLPIRTLRVEVVRGPDAGKVHVARSDTLTVGTAKGNDLELSDETVSRYHLELRREREQIVVEDYGSTNGTLAGGVSLERAKLSPGTVLALGRTQLRIDDGETVAVELADVDSESLFSVRGANAEMRRLVARIRKAAQSDASMLLLGETGSGKEVIARAIHEASPRAKQPFEVVDCGALLPTLIASELFGHEKGAFTGADRQHIGAFERADKGTIFLDEIGELPSNVQAALLGALERKSFKRLGGSATVSVNVRVVSATHRDLRNEVNAGTFRQDLYYRLAVVMLRVPPLRERIDDIPLLVEHFMREAGRSESVAELFPPSAMQILQAHRWPGNVRELRNFVEAALAMGELPHIERDGGPATPARADSSGPSSGGILDDSAFARLASTPYGEARGQVLDEFEERYFRGLIERTGGNISAAAREAKMDRSYLMSILKRRGMT